MSTHAVLKPGKIRTDGLYDASEHRAHLSPAYNYYVRTLANPAFDAASKREIMLLRPLFFASFLVHDLLTEHMGADADTIAITSASSKTAIGLAYLLSIHKVHPCHIVGLTSEQNLDFVRSTGVYDRVLAYDDREILTSRSVILADFSGNSALIRKLQDALGNRAIFFCLIGYTHWDRQSLDIVENARMMRFIAPDRIRKRVREWGAGEFDRRYNEALLAYIRHSSGWLHIVEGFGPKKGQRGVRTRLSKPGPPSRRQSPLSARARKLSGRAWSLDCNGDCRSIRPSPRVPDTHGGSQDRGVTIDAELVGTSCRRKTTLPKTVWPRCNSNVLKRLSVQNGDFNRALDHPTRRILNSHHRSS